MVELTPLARIIDIEYHDIVVGASQVYHDKIRAHLRTAHSLTSGFRKRYLGAFLIIGKEGTLMTQFIGMTISPTHNGKQPLPFRSIFMMDHRLRSLRVP